MDIADCNGKNQQDPSTFVPDPTSMSGQIIDDDSLDASLRPPAATAATLGSLLCSVSDSSSKARRISGMSSTASHDDDGGSSGGRFHAQLQAHVDAGHRGLEAALHLMCERLLDLEGCWEKTQEVSMCSKLVVDP